MALCFFRITFFKVFQCILPISALLSIEKKVGSSFVIPNFVLTDPNKKSVDLQLRDWIPNSQKCFATSLVGIGPVGLEKIFKKFSQCIFGIIFGLKNHQRMPNLVEIGPLVLEKNSASMYFCYFVIISASKRVWLFIWTYLNPRQTNMVYV